MRQNSFLNNLNMEMFQAGLKAKTLPTPFLESWENFLKLYGHRGPMELDIASPRYRDNPQLLYDLLLSMRNSQGTNAQEKFDQNKLKRENTYKLLYDQIYSKSWMQSRQFQSLYKIFVTLGGYRELHKYYLIFAIDSLRQKILKEAQILLDEHRIESLQQVFDLSLDDLEKAIVDKSINLVELAKNNTSFTNRLSRVPQLPTVIDSRGLIFRPPVPPAKEGEIVGTAISAGIVRGRVKVLKTPDEKPFEKGEILVTRATDPGWTPLFVNAAAVILEVGGMLQHGALVAREYGLPCVAGVANVTSLWKDGTMVEVDGSAGIIRLVEQPETN